MVFLTNVFLMLLIKKHVVSWPDYMSFRPRLRPFWRLRLCFTDAKWKRTLVCVPTSKEPFAYPPETRHTVKSRWFHSTIVNTANFLKSLKIQRLTLPFTKFILDILLKIIVIFLIYHIDHLNTLIQISEN